MKSITLHMTPEQLEDIVAMIGKPMIDDGECLAMFAALDSLQAGNLDALKGRGILTRFFAMDGDTMTEVDLRRLG